MSTFTACRGCGCTDNFACQPPCWWVEPGWCSACEHRLGRRLTLIGAVLALLAAIGALVAGGLMSGHHHDGALSMAVVSGLMVVCAILLGTIGKHMLEVEP